VIFPNLGRAGGTHPSPKASAAAKAMADKSEGKLPAVRFPSSGKIKTKSSNPWKKAAKFEGEGSAFFQALEIFEVIVGGHI
jgi:hypothetical protein